MQTAQRNSLRLLQWMMAASLALPLALFVFASAVTWISTNEAADREIERTLDVAHEHALKVFETIDRSLSETAEIIRGMSDADIVSHQQGLHQRLSRLADTLPQVKSVWVFDARGHALVNSLVTPPPDIDFSDRDYFQMHADGDIGTYIGEVLTPRPPYQGSRFFSVSRGRNNDDGSFAGVIQASVLPEYFENFYARIGREPGSFLALIRIDGTVLAHFPVVHHDFRYEPNGPLGQHIVAHPLSGIMTIKSPADGIERRIRYQRLAEYPVYVSAGLETSAIRARWIATMAPHLIFGVPATALLFAVLGLALRRTRRLYEEANRRIEAEEALRHSQRLEALGQLTGGVAHDFNNLLTVIRGSVDMLRRPDLPEPRRLHYIDAISNTVNRAARLTSQLLAFARRQALKPEMFDVGQSLRILSEMVATLIGPRIEIVTQVPDEPNFVNADPDQFETAIINIAVNARDAMNGAGRLTITVRQADKLPSAPTNPASPHGHVAVSVADTGVGIPQDRLERIFEPFFTTKEVGQGTGLGLSQVFGFAKQSGGEVDVISEVGKGSTFTLYLPRVTGNGSPQALLADDAPPAGQDGTSVLVVEDNPEVGKFAADALTQLGCNAVLVDNAVHALEELAAGASRFDMVFTDVVMPGMSGIELAKEIRRLGLNLPIVLASGYSQVLSQQGSSGFELLQKPYSIEQLRQMLHKIGRTLTARRDQAPASS
ncbi:ATP-binding protein [Bradyrhizobium sp. ISRA443]|uniref:hybrid sensor histidine kinase/response regulator n=1 Tax=unclassified Bradyrhizobium TaxID=2631580 RepID=UPI002478F942|nr:MULTISPECIES: hybrid sensor histidine kinase/response regulator [unclassified Bradyrhizobium]WGR94763.1 ATP-binding protein [Bradyrhizobium sp. ISRA435]WGR99586.1 ATP-binding protein [Bradyrhizobium sp. ISRA436]WGS06476.1 ATP-binding protein [Bradyrhizobium sp. ISRA437]WGS13360.1 ATP-binding protein [Bradyrhizobium sp. ISRA443]